MDMKKTAKKIAALVAGATMLGATIMGATALDLSNYPAPFVTDGVFSGKIVVGAEAATSDVVGAIDLAASLQALATKTSNIAIPGAAGTASVVGDSAEFKTGSDIVAIGEPVGEVKGTFTELDLKALKSGVFVESPVKQYLKFDNTTMYVKYAENDDDQIGDFLYVPDGSTLFEYQIEFTEGAVSEITSTTMALDDYEGEVLTILGAPFTIVSADMDSGNKVTLSMLGGQVADVLRDGETKTYTIDGKDYEVTAVFIDSALSTAKLSVNGVMTKARGEGETQVLSNDVTIGIQSVMTNQREGLVEFYLGANKLELIDTDCTNTAYAAETVKVGGKTVSNAQLIIKATNQSSDSELKLNYIKYKITADDDFYIPVGKGLKEFLGDYKNSMLTDTWDVTYAGLVKVAESEIKFDAKSNYAYELNFENINGVKYSFPLLTNKDAVFKFGDDDDDFVFTEPTYVDSQTGTNGWDNETFISDNDYFILSDRATSTAETKAVTSILRYQSINTGDSTVTFKDLAGGDIVVSYSGTVGAGATGQLIVNGATHNFYVGNTSATASEKYALLIDLDGVGGVNNSEIKAVTKGGGIIDFGTQTFSLGVGLDNLTNPVALTGSGSANVTLTTTNDRYDEVAEGPEVSNVSLTASGAGSAGVLSVSASIAGSGTATLTEDPDKDEYSYGYTDYGVHFEKYTPTSSNSASELTIMYPGTQRYPQVFVTAGVVEVKESSASAAGTIQSTTLNPIAVGMAVLDTDVLPAGTNVIVVGGPCVNAKAAELMGNPAECAEGFTPGKAVIKLFADKNALLVAGYSAQDTMGACYVLAQYADYKLSGTEVEVVVADLNTITVNKIV